MDELLIHPVARSATRRHLVLGGERGLVFVSLLVTTFAVFTSIYLELLWLVIPAIALQISALTLFRNMAKRDEFLAHVYWRRIWIYRHKYYPPLSTPVLSR